MTEPDELSFRLHPKLRVIRNGDDAVNGQRALRSCIVASVRQAPPVDESGETDVAAPTRAQRGKPLAVEKLVDDKLARNAYVNVFVELKPTPNADNGASAEGLEAVKAMLDWYRASSPAPGVTGAQLQARGHTIIAAVPVDKLFDLQENPYVAFVQPAEPIRLDQPAIDPAGANDNAPAPRRVMKKNEKTGQVMVGIIDVGGFDFAHPDFLEKDGKTRFVAIWDQGGTFRPSPKGFDYGAEFTADRLNKALAAGKAHGLPATRLERQSQRDEGSHGTHVASIAAGNRGVCPHALIAGVLVSLPTSAGDDGGTLGNRDSRRVTFSDSSRILDAVTWLQGVAKAHGVPLAINLSLGANGGAHDGTSATARWLEHQLGVPGIALCVAGGNAGHVDALGTAGRSGMLGRVHAMGTIPAHGLQHELEWIVAGDDIVDASENEMEIWYSAQDRVTIRVQAPGSSEWVTVRPGEYVENRPLANRTFLSIYNELYHPANGCNYIGVYLSPDMKASPVTGVAAGTWRVRLVGEEIRDGRFHAWIERDDPAPLSPDHAGVFYYPSYFSARTVSDSHTINTLACSDSVIAVANLDDVRETVAGSSSPGPTRDGRPKPDIAAPGTDIVAANAFSDPDTPWLAMSGTSMASPYVCGAVAWMLSANPELTSAQCRGILQRTSQPLVGATYAWNQRCGFGRIDPQAAIAEAARFNVRTKLRDRP